MTSFLYHRWSARRALVMLILLSAAIWGLFAVLIDFVLF